MGLITENNSQYYAGSQHVLGDGSNPISEASFTFDTPLSLGSAGSFANTDAYYALNNFKIYVSTDGGTTFVEWLTEYALKTSSTPDGSITSIVTFVGTIPSGTSIVVVQLKSLTGGQYGNRDAFGDTVEENYGSYSYLTLNDAVENYMVGFVGDGKIIQTAKKYDINFHAKRGLQEFSYDLLKSIKSQELSVPDNLSIPIPQDYVNYVKFSWVDSLGVKHIIYPTTLTSNPGAIPLQDVYGKPVQDAFDNNIETTSVTEQRWDTNDTKRITGGYDQNFVDADVNQYDFNRLGVGQRYGSNPLTSQTNGWFTINERTNQISFSSNLVNKIIIFDYVSDGLAYDADSRVPKMAEDALYAYISHAIVASRANQPEYLVQRLKKEKSAKMRNAKIRLSNIKLEEITQVMRGKSKWIKH